MKYKVGDHIEHKPSGDYLGVITEVRPSGLVRFEGDRKRDGVPVTLATVYEIKRCSPPKLG